MIGYLKAGGQNQLPPLVTGSCRGSFSGLRYLVHRRRGGGCELVTGRFHSLFYKTSL